MASTAPYLGTAAQGGSCWQAADGSGGPVGLMRGASGKALLLIRLYERTGNPDYLDAAEGAIAADLARCVYQPPLWRAWRSTTTGGRTLPYLGGGAAASTW